jgi:hypothetical protein
MGKYIATESKTNSPAFEVRNNSKLVLTIWASPDAKSDALYIARALNLRELNRDSERQQEVIQAQRNKPVSRSL